MTPKKKKKIFLLRKVIKKKMQERYGVPSHSEQSSAVSYKIYNWKYHHKLLHEKDEEKKTIKAYSLQVPVKKNHGNSSKEMQNMHIYSMVNRVWSCWKFKANDKVTFLRLNCIKIVTGEQITPNVTEVLKATTNMGGAVVTDKVVDESKEDVQFMKAFLGNSKILVLEVSKGNLFSFS